MCDLNRVQLGDLLDYEQPTRYIVSSTDYDDTYDTPVLTAGQTFILGYTNETKGIYKASKSNPVIIFDDFVTSFYLVDFDFKVKSSALKILKPKKGVNIYYVYYAMLGINFVPKEHARHWISKYSLFEISYPSLAKQQEIVSHLDTFTTLISNLESELDMRRKQYEHYRNQLLDFEGVEIKTLNEIADIVVGFPFDSSKFVDKGTRLMRGMNIKRGYLDFDDSLNKYWNTTEGLQKYELKTNDIVISMDGSLVGRSFAIIEQKHLPLLLVQRVARIRSNYNIKFIYYNICMFFSDYVDKKKTAGAIPHISMKDIQKFSIPFPSSETQQEIVEKLDAFENLIQSLEQEIKLRKKQYEFYREKLLTFEKE